MSVATTARKTIIYPVTQRNHKYIHNSVDQWLDIHFGDTSFNGRVVLGHRKHKSEAVVPLKACSLTDLRKYVKMIHISSRLDYYITANTVTGQNRRAEDLFGLQNIVIDIDCHGDDIELHAIPTLVETLIWYFKRDLCEAGVIPTPNSIVRTGRGIQLWWAIVPCYGGRGWDKSLYHHNKIKNTFMDHIQCMLDEHQGKWELSRFSLDRGTSSNNVGYFRLPCTYNTKAKCYGSVEILHDTRYDQRELTRIEPPVSEATRTGQGLGEYVPMLDSDRLVLTNFESVGVRRVIQLIKLRNLRNNTAGEESRNDFNFSVYNALRMSFDHKSAMIRLAAFNAGFKQPMSPRELENSISSAKAKGGYKYSNESLIDLLEITSEEQEAIGLFPSARKRRAKQNASRDAVRMALKEDRDNKIVSMVESGVSQAEVARTLGISKNTVGSVMKRFRSTSEQTIEEVEIMAVNDRPNFGAIYVLRDSVAHEPTVRYQESVSQYDDVLFDLGEVDSS